MAGKTFPGIGDLEDEVPPLDPADAADSSDHSQSNYSGPTVVDDAKVEQGLKKLRSLDAAPGPLTGIDQAIVEVLTDPARVTPPMPVPTDLLMPEITIDPGRGTAVGRSVSGPVVGQQTTQPMDDRALRGTMFGHGVHLPDLEEARRAMLVETSKALAVVERGVPTTNEITVFQPGTYPQQANIPRVVQEDYPRPNRIHVQETPIELRTVLPRKKLIIRVAMASAGIAAIVVAALLWVRSNDEADLNARSTVPIPLRRSLKPVEVQPIAPPAPPPPTPAQPPPTPAQPPAAIAPPPVVPMPDVAAAAEAQPTQPSGSAEPGTRRTHAHHHAPASPEAAAEATAGPDEGSRPDKLDKAAKAEKPNKPDRPDRPTRAKRPVEDDPDGTMAPTIE